MPLPKLVLLLLNQNRHEPPTSPIHCNISVTILLYTYSISEQYICLIYSFEQQAHSQAVCCHCPVTWLFSLNAEKSDLFIYLVLNWHFSHRCPHPCTPSCVSDISFIKQDQQNCCRNKPSTIKVKLHRLYLFSDIRIFKKRKRKAILLHTVNTIYLSVIFHDLHQAFQ